MAIHGFLRLAKKGDEAVARRAQINFIDRDCFEEGIGLTGGKYDFSRRAYDKKERDREREYEELGRR